MQTAARTNVGRVVFCCWWEAYFTGAFPDGEPLDVYLVDDKAKTPLRLDSPGADRVFHDFGRAVGNLVGAGKQVFVILSAPYCPAWSPETVPRTSVHLSNTNRLGILRTEFESFVLPVETRLIAVVEANGGKIINPRNAMDEGGFFYGRTADGTFRYMDDNHMRPFYVNENAAFLDALLDVRSTGGSN